MDVSCSALSRLATAAPLALLSAPDRIHGSLVTLLPALCTSVPSCPPPPPQTAPSLLQALLLASHSRLKLKPSVSSPVPPPHNSLAPRSQQTFLHTLGQSSCLHRHGFPPSSPVSQPTATNLGASDSPRPPDSARTRLVAVPTLLVRLCPGPCPTTLLRSHPPLALDVPRILASNPMYISSASSRL